MERNKYIDMAIKQSGKPNLQIAGEVGVTPAQITNWVCGRRNPGEKYIEPLAAALDVDAAWVAGYPGEIAVLDTDAGETYKMSIAKTVHVDGYGTLYLTYNLDNGFALSVIVGLDGVCFLPRDWQGKQPRKLDDIRDIGWVGPGGHPAVVMPDGLPRVLGV